jgi:hypothetical protein
METTIRTKQYGGEIILPNLTSEAGAKTYGPPCISCFEDTQNEQLTAILATTRYGISS